VDEERPDSYRQLSGRRRFPVLIGQRRAPVIGRGAAARGRYFFGGECAGRYFFGGECAFDAFSGCAGRLLPPPLSPDEPLAPLVPLVPLAPLGGAAPPF
jgi:hypothetical protein